MTYYAKLLLFGEYTIINGSNALAMPFRRYGGQWRQSTENSPPEAFQEKLAAFADYLADLPLSGEVPFIHLKRFRQELSGGLYFDSDIPTGYGLGSSGALCAAVYDRYAINKIGRNQSARYPLLQKQLATMESFFHGSSSGTDPLICYLEQSILLLQGGQLEKAVLPYASPESPYCFFLLDTGISRQTGPFVEHYLSMYQTPSFASRINSRLIPQVNGAIQNLLAGEWDELFGRMAGISNYQLELLPEMIPAAFQPVWKEGMGSDIFRLKLCGAGGGGYLLGYTNDYRRTKKFLKKKGMTVLECPVGFEL